MKKYILLIVLLPAILLGQNFEPVQKKFIVPAIGQDSVYLSSDSSYFQQTSFIYGEKNKFHIKNVNFVNSHF